MIKIIHFWYPVLVGTLLGLMQMGLFFQLSLTLSSSYTTFLLITLSWLIGSAIGATLLSDRPLRLLLIIMIAGYGIVSLFVESNPFQTEWWFIYALIIVLIGLYPGAFFGHMGRYYPARLLFFRENNGFIMGIIIGTLSFAFYGKIALWSLPVALVLLLLVVPDSIFKSHLDNIEVIDAE